MKRFIRPPLFIAILALAAATPVAGQGRQPDMPTGLLFVDETLYRSIPLASTPLMGELPPKADLSAMFPVPGNQGRESSCVGWAVAYALKSYQEAVERKWRPDSPQRLFSPAYIYNQIRKSPDCQGGTSFVEALNLVRKDGVALLSDFPYIDGQCAAQPDTAVRQRARVFAISDWRRVNVQDETEVKNHLAAGFPVLAGIIIDRLFFNFRGGGVYKKFSGQGSGGHAVVVVGYDDGRKAFKLINSWGRQWGDGGFGWISYDAFREVVREGYVVQDIVTVPPAQAQEPEPAPSPSPTTGPKPAPGLKSVPDRRPTPAQVTPATPSVTVGVPLMRHNVIVPHPGGVLQPGNGMVVTLPGTLGGGRGQTLQLVVRFSFQNGAPLIANAVETHFRDVQGLVATGTPPMPVTIDEIALDPLEMGIPYYALNLQPTNGSMTYLLQFVVTVYLNNFVVSQSQPVPFFVRW